MNGIIIINKEKNWTSNDVVQIIKGIFHEKVGHTGTLDPLATGVIPILVGKGTLLSKYLVNHDKEYIATIKLGEKTSTGDLEGAVIEKRNVSECMLDENFVKSTLKKFEGIITQTPPIYSAIKVNGKKLYEYARKGQNVEIPTRDIEIYQIELISISKEDMEIKYMVHCSKGTYIRTLCEDIAKGIGTVGFMKELQRIKVGDFSIENSLTISELDNKEKVEQNFISIEKFFENKEKIDLSSLSLNKFLNGVKIKIPKVDNVYKIYCNNKFIGTGNVCNDFLKRDIIVTI